MRRFFDNLGFFFDILSKFLKIFFGDNSFWAAMGYAALLGFVVFSYYAVAAWGPGLLRRLLFRIFVKPKLERIYRENHEGVEEDDEWTSGDNRTFFSRVKGGASLMGLQLRNILPFSFASRRRGRLFLSSDTDEGYDALSLHSAPSGEEGFDESIGNDPNEDTTEPGSDHGRTGALGAGTGRSIGSAIGATLIFPLRAAIRLGEMSSALGRKAQAMRIARLRERRGDLPGDIRLP